MSTNFQRSAVYVVSIDYTFSAVNEMVITHISKSFLTCLDLCSASPYIHHICTSLISISMAATRAGKGGGRNFRYVERKSSKNIHLVTLFFHMFIVCLRITPFKKCYFDLIVWCLPLSHLRRRTTRTRLKAGSLSLPRCTRTESRSLARPTTQFSSFTTSSLRGLQWLYPSHVSQSSQHPHYLSYHYIHKLFFCNCSPPSGQSVSRELNRVGVSRGSDWVPT